MSILKVTHDDTVGGGKGKPLPNGKYRVLVESAQVRPHERSGGTQFSRQYGNIRNLEGMSEFEQANGSTFRIGGRKLFADSWIDHNNEQATEIGNREIKREAIAVGLIPKPEKGQTIDLPYETFDALAEAIVGRELVVRVEQKTRKDREGKPKKDDEGNVIVDAVVVDWLSL